MSDIFGCDFARIDAALQSTTDDKEATNLFKEACQRLERMLLEACNNIKVPAHHPKTLGNLLNAICRPPHDPFDRVLEETLRKVLRYRNQSVHDGIILPVSLVREYLRAMDQATITLESAGFFYSANIPATAAATPSAPSSASSTPSASATLPSSPTPNSTSAAASSAWPTPTPLPGYPPSPAREAAAAAAGDSSTTSVRTLALTVEGSGGKYVTMETILAAAAIAAQGMVAAAGWAVTTSATLISGAIMGGASSGAVATVTAGPVAGVASAVPGTVGGLAAASMNVAASTASSIGMFGARLGTRLWVGAATEVARMVGNQMTTGRGEVVETTVVTLPTNDRSSTCCNQAPTGADGAPPAPQTAVMPASEKASSYEYVATAPPALDSNLDFGVPPAYKE